MTLCVGRESRRCLFDGPLQSNRRQDVLQRLPFGDVMQHVADRRQRKLPLTTPTLQLSQPSTIIAALMQRRPQKSPLAQTLPERPPRRLLVSRRDVGPGGRRLEGGQPMRGVLANVAPIQPALALGSASPSQCQQPAEIRITGSIANPDQHWRKVSQQQLASHNQLDAGVARGQMSPHGAGQSVRIGDGPPRIPQFRRTFGEFRCVGGPGQKCKVGVDAEFHVGKQAHR